MKIDQRTILFTRLIDADSLDQLINGAIIPLVREDLKEPIKLWICSGGGSLIHSLAFFDFIRANNVNLTTIGTGLIWSGAIIILAAGRNRQATMNTRFGLHSPQRETGNENIVLNTDVLHDINQELQQSQQTIARILSGVCRKPRRYFYDLYASERQFDVNEAKRHGLIQKIIRTTPPFNK